MKSREHKANKDIRIDTFGHTSKRSDIETVIIVTIYLHILFGEKNMVL